MSETHRGAFGEYGGDEAHGFIDRTFKEQILLVGVSTRGVGFRETMNSLRELARLVTTAGANPVEKVITKRDIPHPATYLGKGKVTELKDTCERLDIDTVVFDHELTPAQQVNLEKLLGRTAIDRTTVILDIFAQNASSMEGKVQVELAQLKHKMARLRPADHGFSQQAGGIGTRGPGETKLETGRRAISSRVTSLEKQLDNISKRRASQHRRRKSSNLPQIALVGYTNAGKSSLLNALSGSEMLCQNRLFSTLDAATRRFSLPDKRICLITDTVGFIRKLPHTLVEAFASTFSGITESDLILHIQDVNAPDMDIQMAEVKSVLEKIGAASVRSMLVFNKVDLLETATPPKSKESKAAIQKLQRLHPNSSFISSKTGQGIDELVKKTSDVLSEKFIFSSLLVPFEEGKVIADVHSTLRVLEFHPAEGGMYFDVELTPESANRFAEYEVAQSSHI